MTDCCHEKSCDLEKLPASQAKVLWIVLFINLTMFFIEAIAGWTAQSISLLGDSLDMLGDALAYGSSLYVINRGVKQKAGAAMFKSALMLATGIIVLIQAIYRVVNQVT